MALMSFASYKGQTRDTLQQGVIHTVARTSDLLGALPVEITDSLLYRYNYTEYDQALSFTDAGETFENSAVDVTTVIEELKHLGTYVDVPLQYVRGQNVADLRANATEVKAENFAKNLEKAILYSDGNNKSFKGLDQILTEGKGTTITEKMSYDSLCRLVDSVPNANFVLMNRKTSRVFDLICKEEGYLLGSMTTESGKQVRMFNEIPVFISEQVKNGEVFVMELGQQGVSLVSLDEPVKVMDMGLLDSAPVYRSMIEGSYTVVVRKPTALAKLKDATITRQTAKAK